MGEDVLVIGVIRFSCYTYNHEPAFNIMGGFGKEGFSIITEVALEDGCQSVLTLLKFRTAVCNCSRPCLALMMGDSCRASFLWHHMECVICHNFPISRIAQRRPELRLPNC